MIPKKTIDEIFDTADIVEVIGGFVNLKFHHRHGYSWTVTGENP